MSVEGAPEARSGSLQGRLARLGFVDPARAVRLLSDPGLVGLDGEAVDALALAPDPDLALATLSRIADTASGAGGPSLVAALDDDEALRARLYAVLGTSVAFGDHLVRHPDDWRVLAAPAGDASDDAPDDAGPLVLADAVEVRAELLRAVGADPLDEAPVASAHDADTLSALRAAYRRRQLHVAAADIADGQPFPRIAAALSDLADATLEAALAIARAEHPDDAAACRLAVVAMGKCGGRELNYISDVDVLFVAEPVDGGDELLALQAATRLAQSLMRACVTPTAEGVIWEVDPNLRPEGKQGALVRTLASYEGYYVRWASTWEFQALLKARPAAGDLDLGARFVDLVTPMVWSAADRPHFVEDVQAMRRRVEQNVPVKDADRQLKLGAGGLRDVEFSVQLLQLVHGRSDVMLHSATTLDALEALATWGYVGREDASALSASYAFLRTLEHRIQVHRLRRTHVIPDAEDDLRRIARSMGLRTDPVAELTAALRRHRQEVRRLHEKLFYRPLLNAVARLDAGEARLTPEAARQRLEALGYTDPAGALRHLEALTSGVTRRAAIQRTLLPVMLGWFASAPDPDAGLLAFRRMSDALGSTPWYLRLLRDESLAAQRLALVLATSRYASDLLLRAPDAVTMLADDAELEPRPRDALVAEALAAARRHDDPAVAIAAVRAAPPRAVPHRRRRAARRRRGRRGGGRAVGHRRSDGHRRPRDRGARGGGHPGHRAADAVPRRGHGPIRRRRARLRQRRRRHVRARPAAGRRRARRARRRARCRGRAAPPAHAPHAGPAAGDRRRPAPRGTQRTPRAHARVVRRLLRALVVRLGVAGAAARGAGRRRRGGGARVHGARRPAALPGGRDPRDRRARDPPAQGPHGGRAAAARRRPRAAHQARSRRALGRRVGGAAAPAPARARRRRPAHHAHAARACRRRRGRSPGSGRRRPPRRGVAHRHAGARRRHAESWQGQRHDPDRCAGAVGGLAGDGLPAGGERGAARRLPSHHPPGAGRGGEGVLRVTTDATPRRSRVKPRVGISDALAVREFRGLVLAQVASEAGDQIARVALALLVLAETDSALLAAATFAVSFIPTFLGAALLGPLADRFSRRTLMLVADLARAVTITGLALAAGLGLPLWVLFVLLFVAELFTPVFESARAASVPDILQSPQLVTVGTGLTRSLRLANQAIGLVLGGLVVQFIGSQAALVLDAASFLLSFALVSFFMTPRTATLESTRSLGVLLADLREGWGLLMADRSRRALVLLGWAMAASLVAPEAVALAYVRDQGQPDAWGGILMASVITGAAVGSVYVGRRPPRQQLDLLLPLAIAVCLPLLVTGIEPPTYVLVVLWTLSGAAQAFLVPVMSFSTLLTPNEHRGRVIGIASAGFAALTALGYLLAGYVADATSPAFAVTVMAVLGLVIVSVAFWVWPAAQLRADVRALESAGH
ncbi:MAG: bifunctional [glutamine synthetase] adenylyltransferase/[glutamine synthetase]-adenylyl-L-tyrosine phosphorylase [Candidatus Nanopelagicales bacterium]